MSLEIEELKVLKMKLFEHLDNKTENISLGAAQMLIHLAQIQGADFQEESLQVMREMRDSVREGLEMERKEKREKTDD